VLELRGLRRSYGSTVALDDLSFSVEPGELFGFVGPNGAGKTTAMRIVLGVLAADAGTVLWRGRPADAEARRRFGYIPEERGLYPKMSVDAQLVYFARLRGLDAEAARASTARWVERLGLSERATDRVEKLSLGNQQRVQLGVALVHQPELLVLDEPFSGLDPIGVDVLSEVLRDEAARGIPVVFSSHQLELVERLCRSVAIINGGRLVVAGRVDELRRAHGRRRMRVEVEGASDGWAAAVAGVRVVTQDDPVTIVELEPGADDQALLDAARAAGRVRHFSDQAPSLTDLFREAVAA
jgi:ABC-2 type transport system ATP-binding protein